jgi:hypothetical protein
VDVVADGALGAAAGVVVVRAEVDEVGLGVGQQVPDDGQDGAADGDDGPLRPAAAGDPAVTQDRRATMASSPVAVGVGAQYPSRAMLGRADA